MPSKITNRRVLFGALLVVILSGSVCLIAYLLVPPEPSYQGKPFSDWMAEGYPDGDILFGSVAETNTDKAIRSMGTNVIPYLLRLLDAKQSRTEIFLMNHPKVRLPDWLPISDPDQGYWKAFYAFMALGPEGKSAMPELVKIAFGPDATQLNGSRLATYSLAAIGTESVPLLSNALADQRTFVRFAAARGLGEIGADAEPAIPAIIKCLKDPDENTRMVAALSLGLIHKASTMAVPALIGSLKDQSRFVRGAAAISLGIFQSDPGVVVPALINALEDPNANVQRPVIVALGKYGVDAKAALPKLISVADDKNSKVRDAASNSVQQINVAITAKERVK